MTHNHFQKQMGHLAERWKGIYVPSLVDLIWREVKDFPDRWFTQVTDDFLGNLRQAPLMSDFREKISAEREREWGKEKKQHAQDARDWANCTLVPEETKIICQAIVARVMGRLGDSDWESFMRGLNGLGNARKRGDA